VRTPTILDHSCLHTELAKGTSLMQLALSLSIFVSLLFNNVAEAAPIFADPQGDTFGGNPVRHDIALLDSEVDADSVLFRIAFFDPISPPSAMAINSVTGFIDIDIDQDSTTGATSKKSQFSPNGPSGLGTEFFVNLSTERFTPGMAQVVNSVTNLPVGTAELVFDERQVDIVVPRSLFGGDSVLDYGVIVGGFIDVSDEAPNFGQGVASTIPEPTGSTTVLMAVAVALFARRRHLPVTA
jgi:hypothetical protein